MSSINLTSAQLAELRARWVYDSYAAGPPVVALSSYNRRFGAQFFTDDDLKEIAAQAARRWAESIAEAGPVPGATEITSGLGGGISAGPSGAAVQLAQAGASDNGIPVVIYGSAGPEAPYTLETETVYASASGAVQTSRDDWQQILGVAAEDDLTADLEIQTLAGAALTTLTPAVPSVGIVELTAAESMGVYGKDLAITVDAPRSGQQVGLVGADAAINDLRVLLSLDVPGPTDIPRTYHILDMILTGPIADDATVALVYRDPGSYEAQEMLFKAIQVECFRAYLASDQYTRALETQVEAVHKQWQTRIDRNLRDLGASTERRAGWVSISR